MNLFCRKLNHTAAHILGQAILTLYPNAKLAIGPAIEEGFYYDVDFGKSVISLHDLAPIKKVMQQIISKNLPLTFEYKQRTELLNYYQDNPYKTEIINSLSESELRVVHTGDQFFDLCHGEHVSRTGLIQVFDLLKVSAAYWRGNVKNQSLTRIYGVAFKDKADLKNYLADLAYRQKYNHRVLGAELGIFNFDPLIGSGLPIWLERGTILKNLITQFINKIQIANGVDLVTTPVLGTKQLYQTSGHWDHYQENIFPVIKMENQDYILRPMTCPHHITLFQQQHWSYKQLPKIYGENALLYRYEHSGGLFGLERVRAMELIDNHAFVRPDQIESFVATAYKMIQTAMAGFGFTFSRIDLSLRDPNNHEKFFNDHQFWNNGEEQLRTILNKLNLNYKEMIGEAAFYGPKIDFQVETINKKILTIATIQLDFLLPQKFNLRYIDDQGQHQKPILIHLGIIGTLERFIAIYLEQTKGIFPFWLSPQQVVVIPINNDQHGNYAEQLVQELRAQNLRAIVDNSNERLSKKIRAAQISKIPYQIIIGDQEIQKPNLISYRKYGDTEKYQTSKELFVIELVTKNQFPKIRG